MGGVLLRAVALVVLFVLWSPAADADVIGPDQEKCLNKQAGDSCDGGACVLKTCTRALPPGPDGKPNETSYDCMTCVKGATPTGGGGRLPLYVGIGVGLAALAAAVVFAKRKMATS